MHVVLYHNICYGHGGGRRGFDPLLLYAAKVLIPTILQFVSSSPNVGRTKPLLCTIKPCSAGLNRGSRDRPFCRLNRHLNQLVIEKNLLFFELNDF